MTALIELYANNAYSTLGSPITSTSQTAITVSSGSSFPSPTGNQFFRMTITSATSPNTVIEIVYVTARSGNNMTVLRGQEGTTATTWVTGSLVANEATKGTYNQFLQSSIGVDTGAVNAYVVATPQHETSYYMGMPCTFYTSNSNTSAAPTLNLNGLGASYIKNANGSPLISSQLPANAPISVQYNTDDTSWRLVSPLGVPTSLTAYRALVSDSVGRVTNASTTSTQINYLSNWIQAMTESNAANGWIKMPTGLILQWGTYLTSLNPQPITFPIPFPNAAFQGWAIEANAYGDTWGAGKPDVSATGNLTTTGMNVYTLAWNSSTKDWYWPSSFSTYWLAIGY